MSIMFYLDKLIPLINIWLGLYKYEMFHSIPITYFTFLYPIDFRLNFIGHLCYIC